MYVRTSKIAEGAKMNELLKLVNIVNSNEQWIRASLI